MNRMFRQWRLLRYMSWPMTIATALLLMIGVLFVYSARYVSDDLPVQSLYRRQILWAAFGLVCYFGLAAADYRRLRRLSWWLYGACLFLLALVLAVGKQAYGAQRWLVLFGGVGVQPSEFAKLGVIVILARRLSRPGVDYGRLPHLAVLLGIVALPVGLVLKQPDLGTAAVFVPTALLILFAAGVRLKVIGSLVLAGGVGVGVLLGAVFLPEKLEASEETQARIARYSGLSGYQRQRLVAFVQADRDPLGAGWSKMQSEIAVGSGGFWGKGFLKGTQNILGFLPRSVAPTDFIYSVIAEEKGFFGSAVVLLLFAVITVSGLRTAVASRDRLGRLLCVGIVGVLFCHVFVNIAMTVGLMPITGLPLPLLSYGGSFMVVMLSGLGIVQSVRIRSRRTRLSLGE